VQLTRREILQRYQGSFLGVLWIILNPLLMLAIYTLIFSKVLQVRWSNENSTTLHFAIVLFSGLIFFSFFSDCINRAPRLIIEHAQLVTKIAFPVGILPIVLVLSASFQFFINFCVMLGFYLVLFGLPNLKIALFVIPYFEILLITLGLVYLISAVGVFVRDLSNVTTLITSALLFMTPIFYPLEMIPPEYRDLISLNPLAPILETARSIIIDSNAISLDASLLSNFLIGLMTLLFGYLVFQKSRGAFADVL
jgi:lipopolysaccharide transport system permease protein